MDGDIQPFLHGFLTTAALLLIEHAACINRLVPTGKALDWRLFARYALGVLAILAGCLVTAWEIHSADVFLVPLVCASAGTLVVLAASGRWLYHKAIEEAELRGWLKGLADRGE